MTKHSSQGGVELISLRVRVDMDGVDDFACFVDILVERADAKAVEEGRPSGRHVVVHVRWITQLEQVGVFAVVGRQVEVEVGAHGVVDVLLDADAPVLKVPLIGRLDALAQVHREWQRQV